MVKKCIFISEKIKTIVPPSVHGPYQSEIAQEFNEAGLLEPLYIHNEMDVKEEITFDAMKFLDSLEGKEMIPCQIHSDKMTRELRDTLERISQGKLIDNHFLVDRRFGGYYMTLLATRLSEHFGIGLLTDIQKNDKFAIFAKQDALKSRLAHNGIYCDNVTKTISTTCLSQGILANLIIDSIQIDPKTPINNIIEFRETHKNELGKFRNQIADLTEGIKEYESENELRQGVYDIYINKVRPSLSDLEEELDEYKIRWTKDNILKVVFMSTSSSTPLALLDLGFPSLLLRVWEYH